ncbi:hypothetical protein K493DRAFT_312186 [Basidiobolus meristosporus CBS 931.73]|uniref:Sphingomyelin synthase-like domain-containing protein n=1 Tax=Basidiobolus meristosporus CBS 931.73 TaxID=1314790 RepID=A0A1Y1YVT7_9FUNG|nr:hypothetical protein K493DRAFT_312186 [Basidiobolus meristosporus CBS 931.73]|eukprot:ORY02111.1 hypothetical protein K493DRAFT_312186 [Basidiobolus meristosporus CBS 931.73]
MKHEKSAKKILNSEVARLLYSGVFLVVVAYFMTIFQQLSDKRWLDSDTKNPLKDLGFEAFPYLSTFSVADALVLSLLGITLVGLTIASYRLPKIIIFWRRLFWLTGILYLYRSFTIITTTLPPTKECTPIVANSFREMMVVGTKMIVGVDKACTDNIYSGHTMILTSCVIMWNVYTRVKWFKIYAVLHALAGIYAIIASRLHFTVDVLLSLFITYGVYSIYFSLVRSATLERYQGAIGFVESERDDHYQSIAHTPHILNRHLACVVGWMDGLDLRCEKRANEMTLPTTTDMLQI